ncbi:glycoside hydrolase family 79 protein [Amanita thiersii Skay4041]|uniref:Glycoside hydrolase family 79 protein n=1 Tax=Amanita thiersii Skay4041 TaxID=703135 RepID=A0A2A9NQZ7_9AGAR|nr:glycoside hydrolase family 79 protein [Amanita thiersii Skay4041]
MANLVKRSGRVNIRVGGNTQETAVLVDRTPSGRLLEKDRGVGIGTTRSPPLIVSKDLLYMMRNISEFVNVRWLLGIPFNDTKHWRLDIASEGQRILGDYLIALQAGNEPDLYAQHKKRPPNYNVHDYFNEFKSLIQTIEQMDSIQNKQSLIGPSLATGRWHPEDVWNTGYVDAFGDSLAYLAMEHYPTDNCFEQFGVGTPRNAQTELPSYLNHTAGIDLIAIYLNSTRYAQQKGKKLLMFETNTAACGGFGGISDSFGAALWGLDYVLQMAYSNFSMALFHIGGQQVYYNPFTAPPTNQSYYDQWTVGPIYYAALVMAETLGPSNVSQVMDMWHVDKTISVFNPAYIIYENGAPARIALFNYVSDPSGKSDINVVFSLGGGKTGQPNATPSTVKVKYLRANTITQKGNFTWAGQVRRFMKLSVVGLDWSFLDFW